jgi:hypothetical protein
MLVINVSITLYKSPAWLTENSNSVSIDQYMVQVTSVGMDYSYWLPWSQVLEKLSVAQLLTNFTAFY